MRYLLTLSLLLITVSVSAKMMAPVTPDRFLNSTTIEVNGITTPKVVQFNTDTDLGSFQVLKEVETDTVISHRVVSLYNQKDKPTPRVTGSSELQKGNLNALTDRVRYEATAVVFAANNTQHRLIIETPGTEIYNGLRVVLSDGVFRPKKISVNADYGDGEFVNFINNLDYQNQLSFASITPARLEVIFESPHYLSLNEVELLTPSQDKSYGLVFFAKEGSTYQLFSNPESGQKRMYASERLPLRTNVDTPQFDLPTMTQNKNYNPDLDGDGLVDTIDLCPSVSDSTNADVDNDGRGDVCQDPDQDNLMSHKDNCPFVYNRDQSDIDADGIGDVCDDSDERFSENMHEWVLNGVFLLVALLLLGLVAWSVKNQSKKED